ncbi:MAG: hypothetical protein U1G07_18735 [Verrucomicrobiota bacterium]
MIQIIHLDMARADLDRMRLALPRRIPAKPRLAWANDPDVGSVTKATARLFLWSLLDKLPLLDLPCEA